MANGLAPSVVTKSYPVAASAAGTDNTLVVAEAPFVGVISAVYYLPEAAVTGDDTDTRTIALTNKGAANGQSLSVASLALVTNTNLLANRRNTLTLSGTASHLVTAKNDVLVFSGVNGGAGLADPGGTLVVKYTLTQ